VYNSVGEEEIDSRCDALRKELRAKTNNPGSTPKRSLKSHQVHELADAKIKESERLRNALKISKDYEEGGHWKRQEERLQKAIDRESAEKKDDRDRD
jgi:hypothetical protein